MKIPLPQTFLLVLATVLCGVVPIVTAAPPGLPPGLASKRQSVLDSISLFESGNFVQAERVLHQSNRKPSGTPEWESESGGNLLKVVCVFENQNNRALVAPIARLALNHFGNAVNALGMAGSPVQTAHQWELEGLVYEKYLGDSKSAERCYAHAIAISTVTQFASMRLEYLKAVDANEAAKIQANANR